MNHSPGIAEEIRKELKRFDETEDGKQFIVHEESYEWLRSLLEENERITKENVALNSRLELMDKHLQQYREERDSWINAAERLGRKRQQLWEELERLKKEADTFENG